jgi:hypothetical protein
LNSYLTSATAASTYATIANTLPSQTGNSGQYLTTDGAGTLSWASGGDFFDQALNTTDEVIFDSVTADNFYGSVSSAVSVGSENYFLKLFDPQTQFNGSDIIQVSGQNITSSFAIGVVNHWMKFGGSVGSFDSKKIVMAPDEANGWTLALGGITSNWSGFIPPAPTYISESWITNMYGTNLTITGATDLGSISNITITGGSAGQVLTTDGSGNLSWSTISSAGIIALDGLSDVELSSPLTAGQLLKYDGVKWTNEDDALDPSQTLVLSGNGPYIQLNDVADDQTEILGFIGQINGGINIQGHPSGAPVKIETGLNNASITVWGGTGSLYGSENYSILIRSNPSGGAQTTDILVGVLDYDTVGDYEAKTEIYTQGGIKIDFGDLVMNNHPSTTGGNVVFKEIGCGIIFADGSKISTAPTIPTASTTVLGGVKVDGSTITIADGVISSSGSVGTLASRTTSNATTASLNNDQAGNLTITGFKGYALYKIATTHASWVRLYSSFSARTSDASRLEGEDPLPGAGVIAEVITTGSQEILITPGTIGFNSENTPTTDIYVAVVNKSGSAAEITVTLSILQLEA